MLPIGLLSAAVIFSDAVGYHAFSGMAYFFAWVGLFAGSNDIITIKYKKSED